jgi:hypothetical protein
LEFFCGTQTAVLYRIHYLFKFHQIFHCFKILLCNHFNVDCAMFCLWLDSSNFNIIRRTNNQQGWYYSDLDLYLKNSYKLEKYRSLHISRYGSIIHRPNELLAAMFNFDFRVILENYFMDLLALETVSPELSVATACYLPSNASCLQNLSFVILLCILHP